MKLKPLHSLLCLSSSLLWSAHAISALPDTGQTQCYDTNGSAITCPSAGQSTYGQDAQYSNHTMSYTNNNDGTISDNVTGLMWQQTPDTNGDGSINSSDKLSYSGAQSYCDSLTLGHYDDWWLPDIQQLYSLMNFTGQDVSSYTGTDTSGLLPFIDTSYFAFGYGDTAAGERLIDAQYASNTRYVSTTMQGDETLFGVNFADGRIKGYPISLRGEDKTFYVACARGDSSYGQHQFTDNGDSSVTDSSTALMWAQNDSGSGMDWEQALAWVVTQNAADYLGYNDWRLPNIKELQSLLDYTRSPSTTDSATINALFNSTAITNEGGASDYAFYWSNTTHISSGPVPGANAAYMSFGRALGYMNGSWLDVHGAGAQRSDPKTGDASNYPTGHGPQGDAIRIQNYVRLVRTTSDNSTFFDTSSSTLHLPAVSVSGIGVYSVTMTLSGTDTRYNPGYVFDLSADIIATSSTASATFDTQTGLLSIPSLDVSGTTYNVEMTWLTDASSTQFAVSGLGQ